MLRPVLLVGVGGSGGKTLRAMRQTLLRKLRQSGWTKDTLPEGWQMLWVDSVSVQSKDGFPAPLLPNTQYVGLVPTGLGYGDLLATLSSSVQPHERQSALAGWVPETVSIDVTTGAGQARAIGRVISAAQLARLKGALDQANARLNGVSVVSELQEVAGLFGMSSDNVKPTPMVIVVSSVAGGSGSGMFMDVVEALKSVNPAFRGPMGIITVLYTPDVFSGLGGMGTQIPPNTLAAIMETTSGVLAGGVTAPSSSVLSGRGLTARSPHGFGAKCNFLVGASNKNVSLGTQEDVYRAVGESLGSMVMDDKVQENLEAFTLTNVFLQSGQPLLVMDESRLSVDTDGLQSMPFSALGMGRVSIGTDRLGEYLTQLVSRDVTEMLLWPDFDPRRRDGDSKKTREEIVDERVAEGWVRFLADSGLDERDPANDVVDALVDPQAIQRLQQWAAAGLMKASAAAGGGTLPPAEWSMLFTQYFDNHIATVRAQETANRYEQARAWTSEIPGRVLGVTTQSAMSSGLVVTGRLLARLVDEMAFVQAELMNEATTKRTQTQVMSGRIQQALNVGASKLSADDDAVGQAVQMLRIGAELLIDADRFEFAASLLKDLTENMFKPLMSAVEFSRARLSDGANATKLPDGLPNPWETMPQYGRPVPTQLLPGQTERVLLEPESYLDELAAAVRGCLSNDQDRGAWRIILRERAALGRELGTGAARRPSVFASSVGWVPADPQATDARVSGVKAEFAFPATVRDIQDVVEPWLSDIETAGGLARFLRQGLVEFVESGTPEQQVARQNQFVGAFTEALAISAPFVQVNSAVRSVLHPNVSGGVTALVSTIPFTEGHPLHERVKSAVVAAGLWTEQQSDKWFATGKVDSISIFTMSATAMMPMAFDNIMKPIAESWAVNSGNSSTRFSFWANRRARPLAEFIPVGEVRLAEMIRGWFLAGLLGQRTIEEDQSGGWRVGVWSADARGMVAFPFPLLETTSTVKADLPAAVMKSLPLALVQVNTVASLDPLRPYHRLMDLGSDAGMGRQLRSWIKDGRTADAGAPSPDAGSAGMPDGTMDERRTAVLSFLARSSGVYETAFIEATDRGNPFTTPRSWELREQIRQSLNDLTTVAGSVLHDDVLG
jgi:hypothetical protein